MIDREGTEQADWPAEEFREYIDAFRTSSDRARYSLYVVIVATVLIGIANYNLQEGSWPRSRLKAWYADAQSGNQGPGPAASGSAGTIAGNSATLDGSDRSTRGNGLTFFDGDPLQLDIAREEYLRQFISRGVATPSPIPGVWIDFNDLGLIGGIALCLLMLLLVLSIVREHENLHLALFKVRSLCNRNEHHANGDSLANLLYHGLAMRQVLSSPPTLARWRKSGVLQHLGVIFFLPALVYIWVTVTNWLTRETGESYGVNVSRILGIQVVLAIVISVLCAAAWLHSRSMALRWKRAFFRINPGRQYAPQMTLSEWLKLKTPRKGGRGIRRRLIAHLVDGMSVGDYLAAEKVKISVEHEAKGAGINDRDRDAVAAEIMTKGERAALKVCEEAKVRFLRLSRFEAETNDVVLSEGVARWTVAGTWTYQYGSISGEPAATPTTPPPSTATPSTATPSSLLEHRPRI